MVDDVRTFKKTTERRTVQLISFPFNVKYALKSFALLMWRETSFITCHFVTWWWRANVVYLIYLFWQSNWNSSDKTTSFHLQPAQKCQSLKIHLKGSHCLLWISEFHTRSISLFTGELHSKFNLLSPGLCADLLLQRTWLFWSMQKQHV